MADHHGRRALTQAIQRGHRRTHKRASSVQQMGTVTSVDPFVIELHDSRRTIQDDEVRLSQWVKRYHAVDSIDPDDTVILMEKHTGGEVHWIITDVLADKDPTP